MKKLVEKYAQKLISAGLADKGAPLIGGLDAELIWNRPDPRAAELEKIFGELNINSLLFSTPSEPYRSIIEYLAGEAKETIYPEDCETRTFMHDLPVVREFTAEKIAGRLKQRKTVIVPGEGIITWGMVSPEQAYIFYSSLCFACFVKFFADYLAHHREGKTSPKEKEVFAQAISRLDPLPEKAPSLLKGPFKSEDEVYRAISEAGRLTVEHRLVDSFFGNVSFRFGERLYISQTTSSLDELEGCIDPCPLDDSSCAAITASSEFSAHRDIVTRTGANGVLHGHPKFAVIISMDCDKTKCEVRGKCHIRCPDKRFLDDVPIVPGESGTGPLSLSRTMPPAMENRRGVIVYGHGLFTVAGVDFNDAFANLLDIERRCRQKYLERVAKAEKGVRK